MTVIHILNGPDRGESYELKKDSINVGRSPDNDIQLNDILVSRRHLRIGRKKKKYFGE
jgi:pSer/pThr/pTyr-binding forkhead associated (FHA) protein